VIIPLSSLPTPKPRFAVPSFPLPCTTFFIQVVPHNFEFHPRPIFQLLSVCCCLVDTRVSLDRIKLSVYLFLPLWNVCPHPLFLCCSFLRKIFYQSPLSTVYSWDLSPFSSPFFLKKRRLPPILRNSLSSPVQYLPRTCRLFFCGDSFPELSLSVTLRPSSSRPQPFFPKERSSSRSRPESLIHFSFGTPVFPLRSS